MLSSEELKYFIDYCIDAHAHHGKLPHKATRLWDRATPYSMHPVWCATTLLSETSLPEDLRHHGAIALLMHDVVEDTTAGLPEGISAEAQRLVEELTFESSAIAREKIWEKSDAAKLLKLYDKVSNLMDGAWMDDEKKDLFRGDIRALADHAEKVYGPLNITKIARSVVE